MSSASEDKFELVVVGGGGVGKSCLTIRFLKDDFIAEHDATVEENYKKSVVVDQLPCVMSIIDTAGQQEYEALRDQHLASGNGFLLVFALNKADSFEEVKQMRDRILLSKNKKKLPMVVVGNKCDLVNEREIDQATLQAYFANLKIPYFETSAKANVNVTESFQELVRQCRKGNKAAESKKTEAAKTTSGQEGSKNCCSLM